MAGGQYDIIIIGGGIIGLATAMKMAERFPRLRIVVLEKESQLARHQTGHNSGVLHAGIYYKPGSLKAATCISGRRALLEFCDENGIRYDLCGKVIVATHEEELSRLEELYRRGTANGVPGLEMIGPERLKEIEPYARGVRAIHSPATGIIDFVQVAETYARNVRAFGGDIFTSRNVKYISSSPNEIILGTGREEFRGRFLINCGGLFSDRIARLMEQAFARVGVQIVPFRGEYYKIAPEKNGLIKGLIYPVPDPRFPFLGVHFTRSIHGYVEAGPNAVLALAREGYRKTDFKLRDLWETLSYSGFRSVARRYWRVGLAEQYRSLSKGAFTRALQRLVPEIAIDDLQPGGAGVRAQAVAADGALLDDFVIRQIGNTIHVLNAPSPGATASLAIGDSIVATATSAFRLRD